MVASIFSWRSQITYPSTTVPYTHSKFLRFNKRLDKIGLEVTEASDYKHKNVVTILYLSFFIYIQYIQTMKIERDTFSRQIAVYGIFCTENQRPSKTTTPKSVVQFLDLARFGSCVRLYNYRSFFWGERSMK